MAWVSYPSRVSPPVKLGDVLNRIHTEPEQDTYIIPLFFMEKRTPVASMHMFDAVRKLGHPTPHREQKKTERKREKNQPGGLEGAIYRNFGIF